MSAPLNHPQRVVLATGNKGKLAELQMLLGDRWSLVTQSSLGIEGAAETGKTFLENALLKARHASAASGLPAIADDSGLEVDALGGAPGVYSARYAGSPSDDAANNRKLLEALSDVPTEQRGARFVCVIVYVQSAASAVPPVIAEGRWEGRIAREAKGERGFGYDPLFVDEELGRHSAELTPDEKNARSHRGQAVRALCARLAEV